MSKDRTTPGATATAGPGTFAGARGAGASRLPSAPRERKPALAALAVLLILAGALATMLLVNKSGNRISVVKVGHSSIAAGSKLSAGQFVEASVAADAGINYVLWSQVGDLEGRITYNTLVHDAPITRDMLGDQAGGKTDFPPGTSLMGIQVKQGRYPNGQMAVGDKYTLYTDTVTAAGSGQSSTSTGWQPQGTVTLVSGDNSGTATLTVAVPTDKVLTIANATELMLTKTYG
ncbi:hypothetical protein GCM10009839_04250 [Catenulispora yoronensis]|uniref:SAF domain-containing protein n=1 Tax=Catenulispora yoronensis TaxID=450799 RepID=A0ABP5F2L4_9ACTN